MDGTIPPICFGLGSAAIDFRIQTADFGAGYTDKLLSRQTDVLPGGAVANCLAQIARLGGKACWLGKLGRDWIGARIVEQLAADNIDTAGVRFDGTLCSPFNVAVYAGTSRRRIGGWLLPNSLASVNDGDIAAWASLASKRDWLAVELGEVPLDTVRRVCDEFALLGVRIAVDIDLDPLTQCGGDRATVQAIFARASVLVPNRNAMGSLYGSLPARQLAEALHRDYGVPTVVTDGEAGAWACDGTTLHQPAHPVTVIDTVGAGDAFHGGLLWALSMGRPLTEALEWGARCGAEACTKKGAR